MKKYASLFAAWAASMAAFGIANAAEVPPTVEAAGDPATRKIIGDWVLACTPPVKGHKSCVMSQTLVSDKLKKPVGVLTIHRDQAGKLKGAFRLPVGVSLPAGVVVGLEKENSFAVFYTACQRTGCFASFDLTEPLLEQIRKAPKISAVVQNTSKQALDFTFSTRGFPDAYAGYLKESK
ncbi:invasion associated locus B family protein [Hyphomicrobium sp. ghe19]|uniref:invasion associated locus B family protein n=1 Tax=Hyphomicrobium sp. ghe19 TaxID=2682968 RepID=UPI00136698E9|nr:hypothetical protein HYPP_03134 [Hyphomicrobium sp. ghe19]